MSEYAELVRELRGDVFPRRFECFLSQQHERAADAIERLEAELADANAKIAVTERDVTLARSRELARTLEHEKARREMEGTVNERAYEPDIASPEPEAPESAERRAIRYLDLSATAHTTAERLGYAKKAAAAIEGRE